MTKQIKLFGLQEAQLKDLLKFLGKYPYQEVAPAIAMLGSLPLYDATIVEAPAPQATTEAVTDVQATPEAI